MLPRKPLIPFAFLVYGLVAGVPAGLKMVQFLLLFGRIFCTSPNPVGISHIYQGQFIVPKIQKRKYL